MIYNKKYNDLIIVIKDFPPNGGSIRCELRTDSILVTKLSCCSVLTAYDRFSFEGIGDAKLRHIREKVATLVVRINLVRRKFIEIRRFGKIFAGDMRQNGQTLKRTRTFESSESGKTCVSSSERSEDAHVGCSFATVVTKRIDANETTRR